MRFYLGTHMTNWLERTDVPLCVSRRRFLGRKRYPQAAGPWMLDSGGFSELAMYGEWRTTPAEYAEHVDEIILNVGQCHAVAPQDWMCEPHMLNGRTVQEQQHLTTVNYLDLRARLGSIVFPVLQGWHTSDYIAHWEQYEDTGIDLRSERMVGVGSVCRRNSDRAISEIIRSLQPLKLHGFGVRGSALKKLAPDLASADSMAWSYRGRRMNRLPGCRHRANSEANCLRWALIWRDDRLQDINQQRLEVAE